jgi:hypothetical protein
MLTPAANGVDYGQSLGGVVRVETRDLPDDGVHRGGIDYANYEGHCRCAQLAESAILVAGKPCQFVWRSAEELARY